jgi:tetratricopeptide (TPR) repeat protein
MPSKKSNQQDKYLAYFYMALKYKDSGKFGKVLLNLNKSIELNPSFFYSYMNRGVINGYLGKKTQTIDDFSKAISLKPNSYLPYRYRGKTYQKNKEYSKALNDYNKALILKPKNMHILLNIARLFYDQSQYQQAFKTYEEALKLYRRNPKVLDEYAWALIMCSNPKYKNRGRAFQFATQAVKKFPCAVSYDTLAVVYADYKKFKKAVGCQKKAIKMMHKEKLKDYEYDNFLNELNERLKLYKQKKIWKEPKGYHRAFTINP